MINIIPMIRKTYIDLPLGGYTYEYSGWDGKGLANADIHERCQTGQVIRLGHYRVRIVDRNVLCACYLVVNADFFAWFYILRYHLIRMVYSVYHRVIITCHVWGLASYSHTGIPTWRDLNIVKRFKRRA